MSRQPRVPNAWDDDDWTPSAPSTFASVTAPTSTSSSPSILPNPSRPTLLTRSSATSAPSVPASILSQPQLEILSAQPKTFYTPELKILKRASPSPAEEAAARAAAAGSRPSSTKEERERERREKERRYQEARDKIFNGGKDKEQTTRRNGSGKGRGLGGVGRGGKSGSPSGSSSPAPSPARTPASGKAHGERPQSQEHLSRPVQPSPQPQLKTTGTITGFSLNSGSFTAAPIKKKTRDNDDWKLRQVELDGKMLESQALKYGFGSNDVYGGHDQDGGEVVRFGEEAGDAWGTSEREQEQGMDWDEFRRAPVDPVGAGLEERMGRLGISGDKRRDSTDREGREQREEPIRAVREPKGPEASAGKGFRGRGNGRRSG